VAEPLANLLRGRLSDINEAREIMPVFTDWGVWDSGIWVHSLGCSLWTLLGSRLGFVATSEAPAPARGRYAFVGLDVRSDSIWFDRALREPRLLLEFERYGGLIDASKLLGKVKNLLLAHHRWAESAELLVLAYWTNGLASLPQHSELVNVLREGFETPARERVYGTEASLLFFQFVMREDRDGLLHLTEIIERGLL
jgi:hypothetical protein